MNCRRENRIPGLRLNVTAFILFLVMQLSVINLFAQEQKVATIKLSFSQTDSTKNCKANVVSDGLPVKEKEIHLYVKRLYTLLPVGKVVATDENGEANIDFPMDIPGDKNHLLVVVAKIEKDDIFGTVETQAEIKWGVIPKGESIDWGNRSLSASREKAPMILVIVSTMIIVLIWGTIFYIISQLFRIKQSAREIKKIVIAE
jgi:hypothetical protein